MSMERTTIHVGPLEFDHAEYDARGDVLYLRRGRTRIAASTYGTPEGHAVRLDDSGDVIGMTLVNAKWLFDTEGHLRVTVPTPVESDAGELRRLFTDEQS